MCACEPHRRQHFLVSEASELRDQASRCRRLADAICDTQARDILKRSAEEFENEARDQEGTNGTGAFEPRDDRINGSGSDGS